MNDITTRELEPRDAVLLREMLYLALWHLPEDRPLPRSVLEETTLWQYVEEWGRRPGDFGLVAEDPVTGEEVGAVWLRKLIWPGGYGYVDNRTPELSIAVVPQRRSRGIGTQLLEKAIRAVRSRYQAISLSVSPRNPALRLYERLGFVRVGSRGLSLVMRLPLDSTQDGAD